MKIKSLLLGSAAATMAVTTANAADVFIPEPEVVEYVRVCDAAGGGFFYIPGSETCLRVHGYVRYEISGGERFHLTSETGENTWNKLARASLQFSTWADTEYGPLRTFVETRINWNESNPTAPATGYVHGTDISLNFAWIDLAGLRIGKTESYFSTFTGYGGPTIGGGSYGPFDTNQISYTYSNGGFTAGVALEQGATSSTGSATDWGIDDYEPHVIAGAGYQTGDFQVRGVVGFDTRDGVGRGGWTGKIRADATFDPVSVFAMLMYGENSSAFTTWANGGTAETFSVLAGGSVVMTEDLTFNTTIQWTDGAAVDTTDAWFVAANVNYDITDGLFIRPEVQWGQTHTGADSWGGIVRIQRSW